MTTEEKAVPESVITADNIIQRHERVKQTNKNSRKFITLYEWNPDMFSTPDDPDPDENANEVVKTETSHTCPLKRGMLEFLLFVRYIAILVKVAILNEDFESQVRALTRPPQGVRQIEAGPSTSQSQSEIVKKEVLTTSQTTSSSGKYRYSFKGFSDDSVYSPQKQKQKPSKKKRVQIGETGEVTPGQMASWSNKYEEIIRSEVGIEEYNKRLVRQDKLFEQGCKKGGFGDGMSVYFKKGSIRSFMESRTKKTGKRATHAKGVGALGYVVMEHDDRIPDNEFFVPDRVLEIRARHSNSPNAEDDAKNGFRGLALKFSDHDKDSPFDLICQTGEISSLFNADAVEDNMQAMEKGNEALKKHIISLPVYLEATIEGMRRLPDSYYHQHYHTQMTYDFHAQDDVRRLARFRVVPADGSPESGRLTPQQQRELWYTMLLDRVEEPRPSDYLKKEFAQRIIDANIEYKLQIQLHEWDDETDTNMLYNPSRAWTAAEHPWINIATITLSSLLPDDVTENTRFNIGNLPENTLSIPEGTSVTDFNIVPTIRQEVYFHCQKLRPDEPPTSREDKVVYLAHVVTGNRFQCGNLDKNCHIYVSIIGREGRTPFRKLDRKTTKDFDVGSKATFRIIDKPVGPFVCAKVYKEKRGVKTDWYLDYIILTTPYNNKCYTLPCYRWFTDETSIIPLRDGTAATDAQEDDHYMRLLRSFEVADKQRLYQWRDRAEDADEFNGLMGWIAAGAITDQLPKDLRLVEDKKREKEWVQHQKDATSFIRSLRSLFKSRGKKTEEEFQKQLEDIAAKTSPALVHVVRHWKSDEEFARQILNGLNPMKIREVKELPEDFLVTDEMLAGILDDRKSLYDEIEEGKIFMVTYPELDEFTVTDPEKNLTEFFPDLDVDTVSGSINVSIEETSSLRDESGSVGDTDSIGGDSITSNDVQDSKDKKKKKTKEEKAKEKEAKDKAKKEKQQKDKERKEQEKKAKELEKQKKKAATAKNKVKWQEQKRFICAPQCLFYNKQGKIIPIAIQLLPPDDSGSALVFTPKDDGGEYSDWLVAKMWVRVADANVHQYSTHLLGTHLLLEPIALAVARNLPSVHPIYKLLAPHIQNIAAINTVYRKVVIPDDGSLNEVMALGQGTNTHVAFIQRMYESFKLPLLFLPDNFVERGVLEEEVMPNYYYRDDSLSLWEAISDFVSEIISIYYEDDEDVEKDDELAALLLDLRVNGFHVRADVPERFFSMDELAKFCTIVIFRATAQHQAVNAGQADIYSFVPNAPPCLMMPPPKQKRPQGYTEEQMRNLLPPPEISERFIALAHMFARVPETMVALGSYPDRIFTEERPQAAIRSFQKKLKEIQQVIQQRNEKLECPYEYLMPELVASSIEG